MTVRPFIPEEVAYIFDAEAGSVYGQAFLRQRGGDVVTCAGRLVVLIPAGSYARERIGKIYGTTQQVGFASVNPMDEPDPQYLEYVRNTRCDAQGNFAFENVADGEYFVTAIVTWEIPQTEYYSKTEGGSLMSPVTVRNGRSVNVVLSF